MTKYVAKLRGTIVGKRTTKDRTYTHAVVVQENQERARARAYDYQLTSTDRRNFEYYTDIITQGAAHKHYNSYNNDAWVAEARAKIKGGLDAYAARLRDRAIEQYEIKVADGLFEPMVYAWCGRPDLAFKQAAARRKHPNVAEVWVVDAEAIG